MQIACNIILTSWPHIHVKETRTSYNGIQLTSAYGVNSNISKAIDTYRIENVIKGEIQDADKKVFKTKNESNRMDTYVYDKSQLRSH